MLQYQLGWNLDKEDPEEDKQHIHEIIHTSFTNYFMSQQDTNAKVMQYIGHRSHKHCNMHVILLLLF